MAGLDGVIKQKIEPAQADRRRPVRARAGDERQVKSTPGSLVEVLDRARDRQRVLTRGGVFTTDLIETWIDYKRVREVRPGGAPATSLGVLSLHDI